MKASHPLFVSAVRRVRRIYALSTIVVLPFSSFLVAAPMWSSESAGITAAATVMGVLFFAVGIGLAWMTWRHWDLENAPVMRVLRDRPDDVAWIYEERIDSQAGGLTVAKTFNIKIQLTDGKGHHLNVAGNERDDALQLLAEIAPHATFGYSRELAKQYKRDPRSLIAIA